MRVVILSNPPDLSAYLVEILKTWGLALYDAVGPDALQKLDPADTPVAVCPASDGVKGHAESLIAYARRGGTVICFLPEDELAAAAGLERGGEKEVPLRLRVTEYPAAGLAGEVLPVVGRAETYRHASDVRVLAYLSHPGRYEGESAGIVERSVGEGRVVAFAFDLALCVLLHRQGEPDRAEYIPPGDGCARPCHMAADIGPRDSSWLPYADLLSRLFVDLTRRHLRGPAPLFYHLPGDAPGILLYSGDEDHTDVANTDAEMDYVAGAGGRMNLYMIPTRTKSTQADVERYRARHDVGPHPDLRPLDGRPVAERLAEFERQIRLFEEMFGGPVRSVRNHCVAWAGYMEPVEVLEKLRVRMDANYASSVYMRDRPSSVPYVSFGAAMPMRFCRPDGRTLNVWQQHTHISDDGIFSPVAEYSDKISPAQWEVILERIFTDITTRFHTPFGVIIHPGGWALFSEAQGKALLRQAGERCMPIWSYDQWAGFLDVRDTWRFQGVSWDGTELRFTAEGDAGHADLRLMLPATYGGAPLGEVQVDGRRAERQEAIRYRERVALVAIPPGRTAITVRAGYR